MQELDHLLAVAPRGLKVLKDGRALDTRLAEWFENAEQTIADNPAWGHNLKQYQFEDQSDSIAAAFEMSIIEKLPTDVEDIDMRGVRVEWKEKDYAHVLLQHSLGDFEYSFPLGAI